MKVAQSLYEGVSLGKAVTGLITYMRTDSVSLSKEAVTEIRGYITKTFGADYLPKSPIAYKSTRQERTGSARGHPPDLHRALARIGRRPT